MAHPNPHDAYFKHVFSRPENTAAELRLVLAPELLAQLDLSTLKRAPGSFVDPALSEYRCDLVFQLALRRRRRDPRRALLHVLHEHQSTPDPLQPLWDLIYMTRLWSFWLREHPRSKQLPAIVPLVLHQGPRRWASPRSFDELIDLPPQTLELVRPYLPVFRYALDDLGASSREEIGRRDAPPLARLAQILLRELRGAQSLEFLAEHADLFNAVTDAEDRAATFSYILEVGGAEPETVRQSLGRGVRPDVREAVMTAAERLRAEGRLAERRETLLRLLRLRFGEVPQAVVERVQKAKADSLARWLDRFATVETLPQVFTRRRASRG